eukprot:GHVN01041318.1.p1 GENE.GHVN01041318.1~~GHVN01041318.1.p1  ORF type:complete len:521 (+),score=110.51 GHVN01041318.1:200-1762(+)
MSVQEIEVDSSDVIRLILQFLKENNLTRSLQTLQDESQVTLDSVDSLEQFAVAVHQGKWDVVLQVVGSSTLMDETLFDVFEQIVCELLEYQEFEVARQFMRETIPLHTLKSTYPHRHKRLEVMLNQQATDPKTLYEGSGRSEKRALVAQGLLKELKTAPPGRLLAVIGMAMKWQQHQGLLTAGMKFDLFRGTVVSGHEKDECVGQIARAVKFGKKSFAECSAFSPDGTNLVTGSVDGIIEVWDWLNGSLRKDLTYQAEENFMMHDKPVLAITFTNDSELIASGSDDGQVKVWRLSTGECIRMYDKAHDQGITCIQFNSDNTHILTGSFDATARIHGTKSRGTLKHFRGHSSYVNTAIYASDGAKIVTGSSDGRVKVWDARTCDCLVTFSPPPQAHVNSSLAAPSINQVLLATKTSSDLIYVCAKTSVLYLMNLEGHALKFFSSGKRDGGDFVACAKSTRGEWLYCAGEDNTVYCFSHETGKLESVITQTHERDVVGLAHHPHFSVLVSWGLDGVLNLFKP